MTEQQPILDIQRIYLKDASLEAPGTPTVFMEQWEPELHVDLDIKQELLEDDIYEVILSVTVAAKAKEKTLFLVEVQQAGIFHLAGFANEQKDHILGAYFPTVLFPYAREVVADLVNKASFPSVHLSPVNFDAIYMENKEANKKTSQKEDSTIITDTTKH